MIKNIRIPYWFFKYLTWITVFLIAAFTFCVVRRYHVEAPLWDEWSFIKNFENCKSLRRALILLWYQNAEHRLFFPNLLLLSMAILDSWNHWYERLVNFLFAGLTFGIMVTSLRRLGNSVNRMYILGLTVFIAALVFSLRQWYNWAWGIQLCEFMGIFATVTGLLVLFSVPFSWAKFWIAMSAGTVALYSKGNGLSFWLTALIGMTVRDFDDKYIKRNAIIMGLIVFLFLMASYLYHYYKPPDHPSLFYGLWHPEEWAAYVLIYLGSPLINNPYCAFFLGYFGLVIMGILWFRLKNLRINEISGFVWVGVYALIEGGVLATARVGFGVDQALSSRYVTNGLLFWISIAVLAVAVFSKKSCGGYGTQRCWSFEKMSIYILMIVFFLVMYSSLASIDCLAERFQQLSQAKPELYRLESDEILKVFYPDPKVIKESTPILKRRHWSIYRES